MKCAKKGKKTMLLSNLFDNYFQNNKLFFFDLLVLNFSLNTTVFVTKNAIFQASLKPLIPHLRLL